MKKKTAVFRTRFRVDEEREYDTFDVLSGNYLPDEVREEALEITMTLLRDNNDEPRPRRG